MNQDSKQGTGNDRTQWTADHRLERTAQAAAVALVLAIDVSESVSAERYMLQHEGIARAFESPELIKSIVEQPGGIEALVLEWSDPEKIAVTVGWTHIANASAAAAFAQAVRATERTSHGLTAIGAALQAAGAAFDRIPETAHKVIDVKTAPNISVGYIVGVGDQVPPAIEQLGARIEFITADDLAWGSLSRFDAIVTGVRAYERRADLRANNSRLLDYVNNGGTLIVQYNKFEFNEAQYGPFPAKVSNDRVTDEHAPVKVLDENSPLLNAPNRINEDTWSGWVQERGLYFLDANHDSRYKDLLEISDPFEYNKGAKKGALVEAQYGKGRWVYVGLGLWRELPAGVDGSYQLLANLIGLGKTAALPPPSGAPSGRGK